MRDANAPRQHGAVWRRAAFLALLCVALAMLAASADVHRALIEVLEWPATKASYALSSRLGKPDRPSVWRRLGIRARRPVRILWA